MLAIFSLFLFLGSAAGWAQDENTAGAKIYGKRCAACHDTDAMRMPPRTQLQDLSSAAILQILNGGVMKKQANGMTRADRLAVSQWLGRRTSAVLDKSRLSNPCRMNADADALDALASWTSWGGGVTNRRFQPGGIARLTAGEVGSLKLKWAFAVPNTTSMRSQPAIYNGRIIFGGGAMLYSLDASSGCAHWATEVPVGVRSGITIGAAAGKELIYFGDNAGNVQAVDLATGKEIWQRRTDEHLTAMVTGTPVYYDEKLFVPVASYEEVAAVAPGYLCCTFRGSVLALDAATGRVLWKTYTVDEPDISVHTNNRGAKSSGPSGVGVWSAPTIDEENRLLYVTTGDNYSDPVTDKSDGVIALSMEDGSIVWWKQFRSGDAFNNACLDAANKNCPDAAGPDFDFGSSGILLRLPSGRRALVVTQKSGGVYAIDPDQEGEVIWQVQLGKGGVLGGIEWGAATDGGRLYAAISDEAFLPSGHENDLDPNTGGGMFALELEDGEEAWTTPASPCDAHRPCSPAQQAAVTAIPGVVFSGSMDGHLRAYGTEDGEVLWDYDTVHDYATVNGVAGRGGSMDVAGPVVAGGMVFAISGYDQAGASPGNVLLAFSTGR
jgi:polyvinyl alcohol dehydrogenase (cytochrome)